MVKATSSGSGKGAAGKSGSSSGGRSDVHESVVGLTDGSRFHSTNFIMHCTERVQLIYKLCQATEVPPTTSTSDRQLRETNRRRY